MSENAVKCKDFLSTRRGRLAFLAVLLLAFSVHAQDDGDATPAPKHHRHHKKPAAAADSTPDGSADAAESPPKKKAGFQGAAEASPTPDEPASSREKGAAPDATISTDELVEFDDQPGKVRKLLKTALDLTTKDLTYTYGSAEPGNGGMDCSGFTYYVLKQNGFADVPRNASEQYVWLRKAELFHAVLSGKNDTFELDALRPGDILFWTGTYSMDHDPPITHSMLYLGTLKSGGNRVMAGASDGRTFEGKGRWGVSVFDFKISPEAPDSDAKTHPRFVGYARLPGLRD